MNELKEILNKCQQTVNFLDEKIQDINQRGKGCGDTALHLVCHWGDIEAAKILLEAGANVNEVGDLGMTPIFSAIMSDNPELVLLLINSGANIDHVNEMGRTPRQFALNLNAVNVMPLF